MLKRTIVLGSTSAYRRELLARLGIAFEAAAPRVDERRLEGEDPETLVRRLAEAKAQAVARDFPGALVIGSDQVAVLDGDVLGKPATRERAVAQLRRASGRRVQFLTGLCLLDAATDKVQVDAVPFTVVFRSLDTERIERYVDADSPLDCAGSFKSEGLGIALFERMDGTDPSALMGLPLIRLVSMLGNCGVQLP
jgi:MAF protein